MPIRLRLTLVVAATPIGRAVTDPDDDTVDIGDLRDEVNRLPESIAQVLDGGGRVLASSSGLQSRPIVPAALARTMNELLGRISRALERERRLIADTSHELRSPLTVLRTELAESVGHAAREADGSPGSPTPRAAASTAAPGSVWPSWRRSRGHRGRAEAANLPDGGAEVRLLLPGA